MVCIVASCKYMGHVGHVIGMQTERLAGPFAESCGLIGSFFTYFFFVGAIRAGTD